MRRHFSRQSLELAGRTRRREPSISCSAQVGATLLPPLHSCQSGRTMALNTSNQGVVPRPGCLSKMRKSEAALRRPETAPTTSWTPLPSSVVRTRIRTASTEPKGAILEIYDALQQTIYTGQPYQSRLGPPAGRPTAGHSRKPRPLRRHRRQPATTYQPATRRSRGKGADCRSRC